MQPSCPCTAVPKVVEAPSCCQPKPKLEENGLLNTVDLACRTAIIALAAYLEPFICAVAFVAGAVAGGAYESLLRRGKITNPFGASNQPVCAQGYMEFFSKVRFPPEIGIMATATYFAMHMRCDPIFHVPFCSFFIGFGVGKNHVVI